ncbi:MAG: methyltransferase domain-containing protein [Caldilineaceae bacterium]|nr:methyltransferase domain-containing protein [Caldilineaceae bacterium]
MQETSLPLSVEEIYSDSPLDAATIDAILNRSLQPRPATMLYDKMGEVGLNAASLLLDIGCRDAQHTCALVQRFGAMAMAIDPVDDHFRRAQQVIAEQQLTERITVLRGRIEAIPAPAKNINYIWCRDVLNHVADLRLALRECARVLKPGGSMLVYQTFATDLLEPPEAARLYAPLAIIAANMSSAYFEEVSRRVGLRIVQKDVIASEWREAWEEDGTHTTALQLLRLARLRRQRERYIAILGRVRYEVELANCYWGVYQMLGKLCPICYILQKTG